MLNLTMHDATQEQLKHGVVDLLCLNSKVLRALLSFEQLPCVEEVRDRAERIADLAESLEASSAMIGGAPFLIEPLSKALKKRGIRPMFAFSRRSSEERTYPDGTVRKVSIFRHLGFVPA